MEGSRGVSVYNPKCYDSIKRDSKLWWLKSRMLEVHAGVNDGEEEWNLNTRETQECCVNG